MPDNLDITARAVPSKEELEQLEQERIARRTNPEPREKLLQNTTVLSVWLARCAQAGIQAVPAIFSQDISVDEIFAAVDGKGDPVTIDQARTWLGENLKPGTMWRWEQCAPLDLKSTMANGGSADERIDFSVDDPRLIDILFENNCATTKLAVRPVVAIQRHEGYPVEFRCYVSGPDQVAVSNYYPQMGLPGSFRGRAEKAGALALKLYPFVGSGYTSDFCLTPDNELVFLEGGPPWSAGAHPCCFSPDDLQPGQIVLAPEEGALV